MSTKSFSQLSPQPQAVEFSSLHNVNDLTEEIFIDAVDMYNIKQTKLASLQSVSLDNLWQICGSVH